MSTIATLGRDKKLKSRKLIKSIFEQKQVVNAFPLRAFYLYKKDMDVPFQVGFSVSKRNFKSAVKRNRIKRLLREAFRLQQDDLLAALSETGQKVAILFIFTHQEMPDYKQVYKLMEKALSKLNKRLHND
jgi:ribonuclease P protein component